MREVVGREVMRERTDERRGWVRNMVIACVR